MREGTLSVYVCVEGGDYSYLHIKTIAIYITGALSSPSLTMLIMLTMLTMLIQN